MAPAKRRVSSVSGSVDSETKRRCQTVTKAVQTSDILSASCKAMLAGMAPAALKTYQEERHEYQASIVQMLKASLKEIHDALEKKNVEMAKQASKANGIKAERSAAVATAETDLNSKMESATATQKAFDEAVVAVKDAKVGVKEALRKQSKGDAEIVVIAQNKDAVEACRANAFIPLKEGSITGVDAKKALNVLGSVCKQFDLEKLMVEATLQALKQVPIERSAFLSTSVDQLEAKLDALLNGFADELTKGEPAKQDRATAVAAAESAKTEAVAKADAAKETATAAQSAKQDAVEALKAAKKALSNYYPDMKKLMQASDDGPRALKSFEETVLAEFNELEKLAPPPPVAAPVAEEADAQDQNAAA